MPQFKASYNVSVFQRKQKYVWNPPHSISYLYSILTDEQADFKGLGARLSLLGPRKVENDVACG